MHIGVFGAGVIGGYLGVCLASTGATVTLLTRPGRPAPDQTWVAYLSEKKLRRPLSQVRITHDADDLAGVDLCLVTVKAYDTEQAAAALAATLPATTPIVSFQNGLDTAARLAAQLGGTRVATGVVGFNVVRSPGSFRRTTPGTLFVGRLDGAYESQLRELARRFAIAGQPLQLRNDMERVVAGKLLLNLNNGVCAATGLSILDSLRSRDARWLFAECLKEGLRVFRAHQIRPARVTYVGPRALAYALGLPSVAFRKLAPLVAGVERTARSSTLLDLEHGKPTEIDVLNGALVNLAHRARMSAPVNHAITTAVHRLETQGRAGRALEFTHAAALRAELDPRAGSPS